MKTSGFWTIATASAVLWLVAAGALRAGIDGPYTADTNTLHLYHFNENTGTDSEDAGYVDANDLDAYLYVEATWDTSFTNFGAALDLGASSANSAANLHDAANNYDLLQSHFQRADGAFTYEMIIKTTSLTVGDEQQLLCHFHQDSDGDTFQFRISQTGTLDFYNYNGAQMVFSVAIPTTGPDAFSAGNWYHVAVTYNGNENTAGNMKAYWTLMDSSRTKASLLVSAQMNNDVTGDYDAYIQIGNRHNQGENVFGLIDEVRISDIAREPDDFLFSGVQGTVFRFR